jgi:hypothetical protein
MFIDGVRKYISGLNSLQVGHDYEIDSGMGGSYYVRYEGVTGETHQFVRFYPKGSEKGPQHIYSVATENLTKTIFCIIPESKVFRDDHEKSLQIRRIHSEHSEACVACKKAGRTVIEFHEPLNGFFSAIFDSENLRVPVALFVPSRTAPPDHPVRKQIPRLCETVNKTRKVDWKLSDNLRQWDCPEKDVSEVYSLLRLADFRSFEKEEKWLADGKWSE